MNTTGKRKRILLADDHPRALAQAAQILAEQYEIAATATNGAEVLQLAGPLAPDVIVLDISMPVLDGFQTVAQLKQRGCSGKIVFLTVSEDIDFVREATAIGADGYVAKSRVASDLMLAIAEVLAGRPFISPNLRGGLESQ